MSAAEPAANPPAAPPSAFPSVEVMTSTSPSTPQCSAVPRPFAPSTPVACESSTTTIASCSRAICRIAGSFAMSPSIEKIPSVQMIRRRALFALTSFARRSSMSACWYTAVVHFVIAFARRTESMIDAWLSASETTKSPSSTTVAVKPSFAFHADT